mgnify:FL=1
MSRKEAQPEKSPSDKIERLIDEAKRAKTETDSSRTQEPKSKEESKTQGEPPTAKRTLREEILVTLNETSKELSRIIGVLIGEKEAPSAESQILPRYCSYCGRDLLPNALYCDRCGASVKGV